MAPVATGIGRRITTVATRCQKPWSVGATDRRHSVNALTRWPSTAKQRGEDDQREQPGQQGDGHARVGEAAQEGDGEDERGAQGRGHGQGTEGDRAPCGANGAHDSGPGLVAGAQLLAEARDDEQAVVDREAQSEGGGEVEGVDRDLGQARHDLQHEERADDGHDTDQQGQGRCHHAAEDQHEQDHRDGQGDQLGGEQVLLDGRAHLVEHLCEPAHLDVDDARAVPGCGLALVARRDLLDALVDEIVVAGDAGDHERPGAVVVAQRRRTALRPVRHDVGHALLGGELVGQSPAGGLDVGGVDVAAVGHGDEQHHVRDAGVEPFGEGLVGAGRLGRRVLEAAGRQVLGDASTEGPGEHDEEEGGDQHPAGPAGGDVGEAGEHGALR